MGWYKLTYNLSGSYKHSDSITAAIYAEITLKILANSIEDATKRGKAALEATKKYEVEAHTLTGVELEKPKD